MFPSVPGSLGKTLVGVILFINIVSIIFRFNQDKVDTIWGYVVFGFSTLKPYFFHNLS